MDSLKRAMAKVKKMKVIAKLKRLLWEIRVSLLKLLSPKCMDGACIVCPYCGKRIPLVMTYKGIMFGPKYYTLVTDGYSLTQYKLVDIECPPYPKKHPFEAQ